MTDNSTFHPPVKAPIDGSVVYTFDFVVERLVEAFGFLMRMPDPEARFMRSGDRVSAIYERGKLTEADVWTKFGWLAGVFDEDARPSLPGLRSAEVDMMEATLAWIEWVEPRDRKLVAIVLKQLHQGEARPSWHDAARKLDNRVQPDTLRKRFDRAINRIAVKVTKEERRG